MKRLAMFLIVTVLTLGSGFLLPAPGMVALASDAQDERRLFLPLILNGEQQSGTGGASEDGSMTLEAFISRVADGSAGVVRGVYVQGLLAARVEQQPAGNYAYVTMNPDAVTQFALARDGVIGLLAHNTLAGASFFALQPDQQVWIVEGDGQVRAFRVSERYEYRALQPNSPTSDFEDLSTGEILSAAKVFARHYMGGTWVTFQTCIARDGLSTWGRLFVIARPE